MSYMAWSRVLLWVGGAVLASSVWANPTEKVLANGLKVIVKTDRHAPVAVSQLWYRVGANDEVDTLTGVSHVLEHMMFKGTKTVPAGEFSRRVAAVGAKENAFTSKDYTVYFQQLASTALPLAFQLEADRMADLQIKDADFAKEIQVVREERRQRTDDQPTGVLLEQLYAQAITVNPARQPIIGWMDDLQRMQAEDLRRWYQRWYAPNNATLVVVGDVEPAAVFALAERTFGAVPTRELSPRVLPQEPVRQGMRRLTVKVPSKLSYVALAWQVPKLVNVAARDPYALAMLAAVLDGHEASRLPRQLVREKQVATSVSAGYDLTGRGTGLFPLMAVPAGKHSAEQVEAALKQEIARLVKEGISEAELARVRVQLKAARVYEKDSLFAQAMKMGELEALGFSWRDEVAMDAGLEAVTPAHVRAVARQYLVDDTLTVAVLDPQPLTGAVRPVAAEGGMSHVR